MTAARVDEHPYVAPARSRRAVAADGTVRPVRRSRIAPPWVRRLARCCALLAFGTAVFATTIQLLPGPHGSVVESLRRDSVERLQRLKPYLNDALVARDDQAVRAVGMVAHWVVQEGESVGLRVLPRRGRPYWLGAGAGEVSAILRRMPSNTEATEVNGVPTRSETPALLGTGTATVLTMYSSFTTPS